MITAPNSVSFYDYRIDIAEKTLFRDGSPVSLTPKSFDLLVVLASNPDRLMSKADLLDQVWPDSFVEEGNLTFTINLIRKVLGDNVKTPLYIETVPRRGYRFIAPIISTETAPVEAEKIPEYNEPMVEAETLPLSRFWIYATTVLTLVVVALGVAFVYQRGHSDTGPKLFSEPYSFQKLSNNGGSYQSAISPSGEKVVMSVSFGDKTAVWLYDTKSSSHIEVIPPIAAFYGGFQFSKDGESIYFARRKDKNPFDLYRISIFGGTPAKLASGAQGWIDISPDSKSIAFVRCPYESEQFCAIYTVNAFDGTDEKKIYSRPALHRISAVKFTSSGDKILFASGQSRNAANDFKLYTVDLKTSEATEASIESFFNISSIACLKDSEDCIFIGRKAVDLYFGVWRLHKDGKVERLTDSSENFSQISVDAIGSTAVAATISDNFRIVVRQFNEPLSEGVSINNARSASFAPDGRIIYSSSIANNNDIWVMNGQGGGTRQITTSNFNEHFPQMSADQSTIIYNSNQSGQEQIWKMNADGSEPKQLTREHGGRRPQISADSEWVYYLGSPDEKVWRVNLKSGVEELVWDKPTNTFAVSSDGSKIAIINKVNEAIKIELYTIGTLDLFHRIDLSQANVIVNELFWTDQSNSILYAVYDRDSDQNSIWQHSATNGMSQKLADTGSEEIAELSVTPDGKSWLAVQGKWKRDVVLLRGLSTSSLARR